MDGGLRTLFRQHLPQLHWQSIESGITGGGIPDANYCHDGIEGWIEFKQTKAWAVAIKPEQVGWIIRRKRAGGNVYIAVRRQKLRKYEPVDELWLIDGSAAREVRDTGLKHLYHGAGLLLRTTGGPSCWNWDEVLSHLLG